MAKWYGPNFPFYKSTGGLVADRQEDNRLIKNDFLQGIMTIAGERWFRPAFGASIKTYVFEQNDDSTRDLLEEAIRRQATAYHPRIIIDNVEVVESDNPNAVVVEVYGRTQLDRIDASYLLAEFQMPIAGSIPNIQVEGSINDIS